MHRSVRQRSINIPWQASDRRCGSLRRRRPGQRQARCSRTPVGLYASSSAADAPFPWPPQTSIRRSPASPTPEIVSSRYIYRERAQNIWSADRHEEGAWRCFASGSGNFASCNSGGGRHDVYCVREKFLRPLPPDITISRGVRFPDGSGATRMPSCSVEMMTGGLDDMRMRQN